MRTRRLLALLLGTLVLAGGKLGAQAEKTIDLGEGKLLERDGRRYVSQAVLEKELGVVTKRLDDAVIVCHETLCLRLTLGEEAIEQDGQILVDLDVVSQGLGLRLEGSRLSLTRPDALAAGNKAEVGRVFPDFSLPTLAGETLRLSDFRGKRILLVCWASW